MADLDRALTHAVINGSSSGNNTLVGAVAGQKVYVHRFFFVPDAPVDIYFRDGAAGSALTGAMRNIGTMVMEYSEHPYFVTTAGNALVLNLSAAIGVRGAIYYVQK